MRQIARAAALVLVLLAALAALAGVRSVRLCVTRNPAVRRLADDQCRRRNHWIHGRIGEYIGRDPRPILNLGCGINTYSAFLQGLGHRVTALDVADTSLVDDPAVRLYDGRHIPDDIEYDAALLVTVLHHIPRAEHAALLRQLHGRGADLLVVEDDASDPWTDWRCRVTNLQFWGGRCFRTYAQWLAFFASESWQILDSSTDGSFCKFHMRPLRRACPRVL